MQFMWFQISNVPAQTDTSRFGTVRNCASEDGRGSGGRGSGVGHHRNGSVASVKTPSSPAFSRISVMGSSHRELGHSKNADDGGEAVATEKPRQPGRRHEDAHKHHGLPDAIEDAVYQSLQTKRHKHPGLGLDGCWPKCSAVAYKSFNDPGPTQCSKLRVYRPKTSSSAGDAGNRRESAGRRRENSPRPKTCVPVVTADQLTDIKLALCWDLDAPFDRNRPPQPPDEPAVFHKVQQRQPTADGVGKLPLAVAPPPPPQNSSAVMGFVTTGHPANGNRGDDDLVPESRRTQTRECLLKNRNLSAVMELIPNKENRHDGDRGGSPRTGIEAVDNGKDVVADRTASEKSPSSGCSRGRNSGSGDGNRDNDDRDRRSAPVRDSSVGADHGSGSDKNFDDRDIRPRRRRRSCDDFLTERGRHRRRDHEAAAENELKSYDHQQRNVCRPCLACDNPNAVTATNRRRDHDECDHYKMAFKAGVPISTPVKNRAAAAGKPPKHLKVPKPKTTNSDKKKYVIGTLLPPFSMWPGTTARDYPEHWRLTSVYRQAFKPLELRKQPFLQTIYL